MKKSILLYLILFCLLVCGCIVVPIPVVQSAQPGQNNPAQSTPAQTTPAATTPRQTNIDPYTYRTGTPDPLITNIPRNIESQRTTNPEQYIKQIAALINSNSANDFDKVKKAHDFVAVMVSYDAANFWAGRIPPQNYQNVLRTRLAVCQGYSELFKKLCDEIGIPCVIVSGYARGVGTSPSIAENPNNSNHAWNMVTIYGQRYLIDTTWNSGYIDGRVFRQRYVTDYLFLKPEHFIYTHFPERSENQLLARPLTVAQFRTLPSLKPKFFDTVENVSVNLQRVNNVGNRLTLEYTAKENYYLSFRVNDVRSGREVQNRVFVQRNGSRHTAHFSFPSAGQYLVTVFWWQPGASQGNSCGEFIIEASSGSRVEFPLAYSSSAQNVNIISPIEMPLERGRLYTFSVRVSNKSNVAIIHGSTFIQLTRGSDGTFSGEYRIPANVSEIFLGVADSERGRYEYIVRYRAE